MSITSNLYTGAAGLNSHSDAMTIISDNIANVSTVGFKSARGNFSDILGSKLAGSASGAGAKIGNIQQDYTQGSLIGTGNTMDLAIRGEGMFVVNGTVDGVNSTYFTRSGGFNINEDGFVVTPTGMKVQGHPIDSSGQLTSRIGDLELQLNSIPPKSTESLGIVANLNSDTAINAVAFDVDSPEQTSDFSTALQVYDSLGTQHELGVHFRKTGSDTWEYNILVPTADQTNAAATANFLVDTGTITFNSNGSIASYDTTSITVDWANADSATIDLDLGTQPSGADGITTYALASSATFLSQDGFGSGDLAGMSINDTGVLSGLFSNGQERTLGQLVLARFSNNNGLERRGGGVLAADQDVGLDLVDTLESVERVERGREV